MKLIANRLGFYVPQSLMARKSDFSVSKHSINYNLSSTMIGRLNLQQ
jgi:hypothetical protein